MNVRTRFAPSPTGYMHIGNLRTALYAYLIAKSQGGSFILRLEDTDQGRYVQDAADFIYRTMRLTGLTYDEGPDVGGGYGPYVQSQRKDIYKEYAKKLVDSGVAYPCFCTKERLAQVRDSCQAQKTMFKYDRHCLSIPPEEAQQRMEAGQTHVIRQKMPQDGTTSFTDEVFGTITVENDTLEDQVLVKSDGLPTYNFANVIDDHLMEITHVVRGTEYLSSAPKYNLLYEALQWPIPTYVHLPPIMKGEGKKLSKREGDASFEDFYQKGYLKEAIINYIALLGWSPGAQEEIFSLAELEQRFDIRGLSKSPAIFDTAKLRWVNGVYIRKLSSQAFHQMALPYYEGLLSPHNVDLPKVSALIQSRVEVLSEIPEMVDFLSYLPEYDIALFSHKKMKTDAKVALRSLEHVVPLLKSLEEWHSESLNMTFKRAVQDLNVKTGQVLWPVRTAITGKPSSPGGALDAAELLGQVETVRRIKIAIQKIKNEISNEAL